MCLLWLPNPDAAPWPAAEGLAPHRCLQVCQQEHQLSRHFFAADDPEGSALGPLMEPLCTILYDTLRPRFIQLQHLNELCELVDILQHEVRDLMISLTQQATQVCTAVGSFLLTAALATSPMTSSLQDIATWVRTLARCGSCQKHLLSLQHQAWLHLPAGLQPCLAASLVRQAAILVVPCTV